MVSKGILVKNTTGNYFITLKSLRTKEVFNGRRVPLHIIAHCLIFLNKFPLKQDKRRIITYGLNYIAYIVEINSICFLSKENNHNYCIGFRIFNCL